jgi:hypothetical protein
MYGYGYGYKNSLVVGAGGAPYSNTKSLLFDGMDDNVTTSSSISGDITLSGWIDCSGTYTAWQPRFPMSIITSHVGLPNATLGRIYMRGATLNVMMQMYDDAGANFNNYYIPIELSGVGFKSFIWTFNNTTKAIHFYLDGVAQEWTKWGGTPSDIPYLTAMGYSYNSNLRMATSAGTYYFEGGIDEVATFDRVVTPSEIATLSTSPTVDLSSLSPYAWYRNGDGDTYPTLTDNGSGGNDATMVNMSSEDIVEITP